MSLYKISYGSSFLVMFPHFSMYVITRFTQSLQSKRGLLIHQIAIHFKKKYTIIQHIVIFLFNFVLEKDTAYQEVGNYFYPTQTVEKNIGRSFLRGQVNEQGEMSLTSIYCAGGTLHHTAVKVSVGDTFAETPASKDSYETTDLGRAIEKADYKMGEDGGVIAFIVANKDKNIQLQFIGDRTYKTAMQPNDRKAIAELTELARILSGMEQIRKDKKEANLKIEFVTRKMQEQEEEK